MSKALPFRFGSGGGCCEEAADNEPPAKVPRRSPTVHRLRLPDGPLVVGVEIVPRILLLNSQQDQFLVQWYRRAPGGGELVVVCEELLYTPIAADEAHHLRLEVTPLDDQGRALRDGRASVVSLRPVVSEFSPQLRRALVPSCACSESAAVSRVARVLTYNVLSQRAATGALYPRCPEWALRWPFRVRLLLKQLLSSEADILCLQEVEPDAYEKELRPALSAAGFSGALASKRTRRGLPMHGCATFYRSSDWELAAQRVTVLADVLPEAGEGMPTVLLDEARTKGTLVQILALRARCAGAAGAAMPAGVAVGNCHLHWRADQPQLKALQAALVCQAAHSFRQTLGQPSEWPLLLAADLNSTPTIEARLEPGAAAGASSRLKSGVYALFSEGRLDAAHPHHPLHARAGIAQEHADRQHLPSDAPAAAPSTAPICAAPLEHELQLESAYQSVLGREPALTNYTVGFVGTLDYIWVEKGTGLAATEVLDIPAEVDLAAHTALPSCVHPSDHLPLVATICTCSVACQESRE
jgi:mRNA deadenylase 3'-5' endonuclease subunit Ccr4